MIHELKIDETYLKNLMLKKKKAEIRFNDRDYQVGDFLHFWDRAGFEPKERHFEITHIHSGLGMENRYVCLSVKLVSKPKDSPNGH